MFEKIHNSCERNETGSIDDQGYSCCLSWRAPVRPFLGDGEAAEIRMEYAQGGDARDAPDLQNGKPLPTKGMKCMGNLSRAQRLFADQCSPL